ncbi:MAG: DUF3782 domain-containing protein [Nitrospirae bacterium]|nr:DUF3782 domain-containing protein [Nitrospirota bacterium]MBF0592183.1 DUF3782 domain-containing protein [Nitrospirota bacterium]
MYVSEERVDNIEARIAGILEILDRRERQDAERVRQAAEDIRQMQEDTRQMKEAMRISSERVDAQLAKTDAQIEKTEAQLAKTEAQLAKTDAQLEKTDAQLAMSETTLREAREQLTKTEKAVERAVNAVNALTGKWGNFVVGLVFPATKKMFKERGIDLKKVHRSVQSDIEGAKMEIDIMGVSSQYIVAIEIKSTLEVNDVNDHLERLAKFKQAFDEYTNRIVIGAVSGIVINEGVDKYAYHSGLFVIGESGDTVMILNDNKFVPRYF